MIFNYEGDANQRPEVLKILKDNNFPRVLDVGGSMLPWIGAYATHYLDIINIHEYLHDSREWYIPEVKKAKCFLGDINDGDGWEEIIKDVAINGRFDFAVCTQTLEDIRNPTFPLKKLPMIAKEGFISVPNKWRELHYVEGYASQDQQAWGLAGPYLGYFHHRWIFTIIEKEVPVLRLFPKLAFVERLDIMKALQQTHLAGSHELSFFWLDSIEYEIINNDYLGPNPPSVFDLYRKLIEEGV